MLIFYVNLTESALSAGAGVDIASPVAVKLCAHNNMYVQLNWLYIANRYANYFA